MDTSTDGDDSSRPTSSLAMATAGTANGEDNTSMKAIMATLNNANASSSLDTGAVKMDQHDHQKPTQVINPPLYQGNDTAQQAVSNVNLNLNRMPSSGTSYDNNIPMALPIAVNASMSNIVNNNVMAMATIVNNDGVINDMTLTSSKSTTNKNFKRLNTDDSTASSSVVIHKPLVKNEPASAAASAKKKKPARKRAKRSDAGVPRPGRRKSNAGSSNTGVGNHSNRSAAAAHRKGQIHIPPIGSPGLLMIPTTSNTSSFPPIGSEEEARDKYLIKAMSDNGVEEEYITPSTVFSQSMKGAGYTLDKRRLKPHRGSSTERTVGDMFDSDVNSGLYLHFPELVPPAVWERRFGENCDRYVESAPVDNVSPGKLKRGPASAGLSPADIKLLESNGKKGPKGARSSYIFFTNEQRKNMNGQFPGMKFTEQGVIMGERWRALNPEEKKPYEAMAQKDKERYNREMKEFLDKIKQEMQDEKKVKAESGDVGKEEKKESPTKEEQPKKDKKEAAANVKEESKGDGEGKPKVESVPSTTAAVTTTKTPCKPRPSPAKREDVKGPRLVDAMILSLSKLLGEKVNRKEPPPEPEEEDEPKLLPTTNEMKAEDVASTMKEMKVDDTAGPPPEEVKVEEPISSPDTKAAVTATEFIRKQPCGQCEACSREDCGECIYCLDKRKFGGPNSLKQESLYRKCARRRCPNMGAVRYSGGKIGNSPQVIDNAADTDMVPEEQHVVKRRRVSPDLTIDDLPKFTSSSSQPQTRPQSQSSHKPQSFLDMLPISLTAAYPPCYVAKRRAYAEAVKAREIAIVEAQEVKDDWNDAQEKYVDRTEAWNRMLEYQKTQIAKRKREREKEEEKLAAKKKEMEKSEAKGDDEEKKCEDTEMKDNNVDISNTSSVAVVTNKPGAVPSSSSKPSAPSSSSKPEEDPMDYMPPKPQSPGPMRVVKIPDIPIPPTPPPVVEMELNSDDNNMEVDEMKNEEDNNLDVPMRVPKVNKRLLSHLDPSFFVPNMTGRYLGLLSNHIADPQFSGILAPGIAGTTYGGGTGLATAYAGGGRGAASLVSGSIRGSLWERSQTAVVNSGKSSPPKGKNSPVPDGVASSNDASSSSKKRPLSDASTTSEQKSKQTKRVTVAGLSTGDRLTTATEISSGPAGSEFPEGWVVKCYRRTGGETVGKTDRFWFSPGRNIRFRAKKHAKAFVDVLSEPDVDGNEEKAAEIYKARGLHF